MIIKTNINRLQQIHDNVNFEPIEKQIFDTLNADDFFKSPKYTAIDNYVKGTFMYDGFNLQLDWKYYENSFYLNFQPTKIFSFDFTYERKFSFPLNKETSFKEMKTYIEEVMRKIDKLREIHNWTYDNIDRIKPPILAHIQEKIGQIKNISFTFLEFTINIIARNKNMELGLKYKDGYTRDFVIEEGKIVIKESEMEYLFKIEYDKYHSPQDYLQAGKTYEELKEALVKINLYEVPEYIELETQKKNAVKILRTIEVNSYGDFLT